MSWETTYKDFEKILADAMLSSGTPRLAFDGVVKDLEELWDKMKRQDLVQELKKRAQKSRLRAKEWSPLAARIDYMSVTERDLRVRFRGRITSFKLRNQEAAITQKAPREFSQAQSQIEST
jgi:hypothetical protein